MIKQIIAAILFNFCNQKDLSLPIDSLHIERFDQYAINIMNLIPDKRKLLINKYGKPIEIKSKEIKNDYFPTQPDSSFELIYKHMIISIVKISNKNEEFIEEILITRGFKFNTKPMFGSSLNSVQAYFGYAMSHTISSLKYCVASEKITPYYSIYFKFDEKGMYSIDLEIANP